MRDTDATREPIRRGRLRAALGMAFYSAMRQLLWLKMHGQFALERSGDELPFLTFQHQTPLLRKLKDVDMQYQYNKITNLRLAAARIDGLVIHPGETFSYWRLIGKPTKGKGYLPGMILVYGTVQSGTGGGLCQLSNLLYWMALHSPLTVTERHRHGYDVFPDSKRTQPFGCGATCYYPHGDLMLRNDTDRYFQICVKVGEECLEGRLLSSQPEELRYVIVERDAEMRGEYWGGYSRHNKLYRRVFDSDGELLYEELVAVNDALMMYSPFLENGGKEERG